MLTWTLYLLFTRHILALSTLLPWLFSNLILCHQAHLSITIVPTAVDMPLSSSAAILSLSKSVSNHFKRTLHSVSIKPFLLFIDQSFILTWTITNCMCVYITFILFAYYQTINIRLLHKCNLVLCFRRFNF